MKLKYVIIYVLVMSVIYFAYKVTSIVSDNPHILDGMQNWQLYLVVGTVLASIFQTLLIIGTIFTLVCLVLILYYALLTQLNTPPIMGGVFFCCFNILKFLLLSNLLRQLTIIQNISVLDLRMFQYL